MFWKSSSKPLAPRYNPVGYHFMCGNHEILLPATTQNPKTADVKANLEYLQEQVKVVKEIELTGDYDNWLEKYRRTLVTDTDSIAAGLLQMVSEMSPYALPEHYNTIIITLKLAMGQLSKSSYSVNVYHDVVILERVKFGWDRTMTNLITMNMPDPPVLVQLQSKDATTNATVLQKQNF